MFTSLGTRMGQSCVQSRSVWISSPLKKDNGLELLKMQGPHTLLAHCWTPVLLVTWIYWKCSRNVCYKLCLGQLSALHLAQSRDVEPCVNCKTSKELPDALSCPFVVYLSSLLHKLMCDWCHIRNNRYMTAVKHRKEDKDILGDYPALTWGVKQQSIFMFCLSWFCRKSFGSITMEIWACFCAVWMARRYSSNLTGLHSLTCWNSRLFLECGLMCDPLLIRTR